MEQKVPTILERAQSPTGAQDTEKDGPELFLLAGWSGGFRMKVFSPSVCWLEWMRLHPIVSTQKKRRSCHASNEPAATHHGQLEGWHHAAD